MGRLNTIICIRFAKKELEDLRKRAQADKRYCFKNGEANISKYIRRLVLAQTSQNEVEMQKELKKLVYQIRKIGVNINQVTAKINGGYFYASSLKELQDNQVMILEELKTFLKRMEKEKGNGDYEADEYQAGKAGREPPPV